MVLFDASGTKGPVVTLPRIHKFVSLDEVTPQTK